MNISDWVRSCARAALPVGMLVGYAHAQDTGSIPAGKKPNIVFILVDNVGWGTFGVYGGTIPTPRIDKLARRAFASITTT